MAATVTVEPWSRSPSGERRRVIAPMTLLADLSYQAALRALDVQERGLGELRQRTGTLLAASSLTASFLGAQTIQHTATLGVPEALALVGLAGSIGSATYVLLPKREFVFSVNAITQYEALFEVRE